ncbi:hypothetical protein [uncultured Clostridium sp.]|uniref:hypothetical protein n=1 Tax=uncultured Clostridium sp. TaxID=59620 RepID=UPI0025D1C09F|nr:hypothetical protein [uncultured Clostridium sp.]
MEGLDITYYGINDLGTQWQIKSLVEEYIGNSAFEEWFENTIKSSIETLNEYINNLKVKVILQCAEILPYIISEEYKTTLNEFYSRFESIVTVKQIDIKLIKYINCNSQHIWECDNYEAISETLKFILEFKGFKAWDIVINNDKCVHYLGFNHFNKTQNILKNIDRNLHKKFIEKILFPLKIHAGLETQLDIVKSIKATYKDVAEEYENIVMEYLHSKDFIEIDSYQKQIIIKKIIDSRCFNNKNEILLNAMLLEINDEVSSSISGRGMSITISSKKYMNEIQSIEDFREKIFCLLYEQHVSLLHLMMVESEELSITDIGIYNGITKNRYKNSTLMKINHIKMQMQVNSIALIKSYSDEFWNELSSIINDVISITGISDFLSKDICDVRFLIENEKYFILGTFLVQIIERLLRELYFKLEYDVVGILKSSNFTLKNLLEQDDEQNPLTKLFEVKELEALNFFLNDRENGENLRNKLAHYTINTSQVSEMDVIFLLNILLFILLKVDYQGVAYENKD